MAGHCRSTPKGEYAGDRRPLAILHNIRQPTRLRIRYNVTIEETSTSNRNSGFRKTRRYRVIHRRLLAVIGLGLLCGNLVPLEEARAEPLKRRGLVGVALSPLTEEVGERRKSEEKRGMLIVSVMPDSAAVEAGLQDGDLIVKIGGKPVTDLQVGLQLLRKYRAGDTVKVTVLRKDQERTFDVTLRPRPKEKWDGIDVVYDEAGPEGRRVRTLITRPKAPGKHPAILFIQSLAPHSIEFAFPGPHHYRDLVESFTKAGFVFMRVDRPGTGDSDGKDPFITTVTMDIKAFRHALKKLKTYDFVDAENVFIFAYGTGGAIAPSVARAYPVSGVLTYGTTCRPWITQAVEMMQRRWRFELEPQDKIERDTVKLKTFLRECIARKQTPAEIFAQDEDLVSFVRNAQILQQDRFIFGMPYTFGQQLFDLKIENDWAKVDAPVLALWGASDYVAGRKDSECVAAAVNKAHPGNGAVVSVPKCCHMFSKAEDMEESFLAGLGEFNPAVVEIATNWIKGQQKKADP